MANVVSASVIIIDDERESVIVIVFAFNVTCIGNHTIDRAAFHFNATNSWKGLIKGRKPRLLPGIFHYGYQRFCSYAVRRREPTAIDYVDCIRLNSFFFPKAMNKVYTTVRSC